MAARFANVASMSIVVIVWKIELDDPRLGTSCRHAWLDVHERRSFSSFAQETHARRYSAAHTSLREILARMLGRRPNEIVIERCAKGRPALQCRSIDFNMTHSDGLCLVAVSVSHRVGIDLENTEQPFEPEVLDIIAHPSDMALLRMDGDRTSELLLWVAKEAVLKADGDGFARDPRSVEVRWEPGKRHGIAIDSAHNQSWQLARVDVGQKWLAAVASAPSPAKVNPIVQVYNPELV
jgi:4'-phosphopantetheinyl transferase